MSEARASAGGSLSGGGGVAEWVDEGNEDTLARSTCGRRERKDCRALIDISPFLEYHVPGSKYGLLALGRLVLPGSVIYASNSHLQQRYRGGTRH